jgi:hypothetical protein
MGGLYNMVLPGILGINLGNVGDIIFIEFG